MTSLEHLKKLIDKVSKEEFLKNEIRKEFRPEQGQWYDGYEEFFVDYSKGLGYYRKNDEDIKDKFHCI